jgi:hypothetical protein
VHLANALAAGIHVLASGADGVLQRRAVAGGDCGAHR